MEDIVAAEMTPAQVIVAATCNSAELLDQSNAGTLETGEPADFLVLQANPLDDITSTRQLVGVHLNGGEVVRSVTEQSRMLERTGQVPVFGFSKLARIIQDPKNLCFPTERKQRRDRGSVIDPQRAAPGDLAVGLLDPHVVVVGTACTAEIGIGVFEIGFLRCRAMRVRQLAIP